MMPNTFTDPEAHELAEKLEEVEALLGFHICWAEDLKEELEARVADQKLVIDGLVLLSNEHYQEFIDYINGMNQRVARLEAQNEALGKIHGFMLDRLEYLDKHYAKWVERGEAIEHGEPPDASWRD